MAFADTILNIENYLQMRSKDTKLLLKQFTNHAIREFADLEEWEKMRVRDSITLDGSGEYDLSDEAILSSFYRRDIRIYKNWSSTDSSRTTTYYKIALDRYLQFPSKGGWYAIFGTTLYIDGDSGEADFMYMGLGPHNQYPLTEDDDDVPALQYYGEIIEKMVVVRLLKQLGEEQEVIAREQEELNRLILTTKNGEKRSDKSGKVKFVNRTFYKA